MPATQTDIDSIEKPIGTITDSADLTDRVWVWPADGSTPKRLTIADVRGAGTPAVTLDDLVDELSDTTSPAGTDTVVVRVAGVSHECALSDLGVALLDEGGFISEGDLKLPSAYTAATTLTGAEVVLVQQSGGWRRTTVSEVAGAVASLGFTGITSVPTASLLGRATSGTGAAEAISLGTYLSFSGDALVLAATDTPTAARIVVSDSGGKVDGWVSAGSTSVAGLLQLGASSGMALPGDHASVTNSRAPTGHTTTHGAGGSDAIKLDDLAAPDDNTDLNATTSKHGLMPKLGGNAAHVFKGDGSQGALDADAIAETGSRKYVSSAQKTKIDAAITPHSGSPIAPTFVWAGSADEFAALTLPAGVPGIYHIYDDLFLTQVIRTTLPTDSATAIDVSTPGTAPSLSRRFMKRLSSRAGVAGNAGPLPLLSPQHVQCRVAFPSANTVRFTPDRRNLQGTIAGAAEESDVLVAVVDDVGGSGHDYELLPVGPAGGIYALTISLTNESGSLALGLTLSAGDRNKVLMEVVGQGAGGATSRLLGVCPYLPNTTTLAAHGPPPPTGNGNPHTYDVSLVIAKGANLDVLYALGSELGAGDTGNVTIYDGMPVGWTDSINGWDTTDLIAANVPSWEHAFIWSACTRGPEGTANTSWISAETAPLWRRGTTSDPGALGSINYQFPAAHGQTTAAVIACILVDRSPAGDQRAMRVLRVENSTATGYAELTGAVPVAAGTGYVVGDNVATYLGVLEVTAVSTVGGVTAVDLVSSADVDLPITLSAADTVSGGTGTGCTLLQAVDMHVDIGSLNLLSAADALCRVDMITETAGSTTVGHSTHSGHAEVESRDHLLVRRPLRSSVINWVAEVCRLPRPGL